MLDWVGNPEIWAALLTLTALEIVLGIDNLLFISLLVSKLPAEKRPAARRFGLALAAITRIALLLFLVFLSRMDAALFSLFGQSFSVRDVVLIAGGLFLLVKGTMEIHDQVEGAPSDEAVARAAGRAGFLLIIVQIAVIDIVFSIDSVITAVGMVQQVPVMAAAILIAIALMVLASDAIGEFIDRHPTVRMLALSFLILVAVALLADGFEFHIDRRFIYFAMAFSAGVEALNILARRRQERRAGGDRRRNAERRASESDPPSG